MNSWNYEEKCAILDKDYWSLKIYILDNGQLKFKRMKITYTFLDNGYGSWTFQHMKIRYEDVFKCDLHSFSFQMKFYFQTYEEFFKENMPTLYRHFSKTNVTPDIYLIDWYVQMYKKNLSRPNFTMSEFPVKYY